MDFDFDGNILSCRGTVTVFSADNLAAWSVGGFKALGSAFRRCQYCMVTCEDMQTKVSFIIMPQRTMARLYIMLIYSLQKIAYN